MKYIPGHIVNEQAYFGVTYFQYLNFIYPEQYVSKGVPESYLYFFLML